MWRELGATTLELTPCDTEDEPETARELDLRRRIERIVLRELVTDAEQERSTMRGSIRRLLQLVGTRDWYGAAIFEHRWVPDRTAHLGHRLELFHIHPSTIVDYDDAHAEHPGRLVAIRQQTMRGSETIPGDRLIALPYGSFDGEWEGHTRWRSIGMYVEAKMQALVSYGVYLRRSGGILTVAETELAAHDGLARQDIEDFLDSVEEGTAMAGYVPRGTEAKFLSFASNAGASPVEMWRYVDQMIDHLNHQHADSLGASAGTGSRALGETFVVKEANKWNAFVNELLRDLSDALFPMIARDLGYEDCRPPVLSMAEETISVSPAQRRERIHVGIEQGFYPKTPALVRWLAQDDGLAEDVIAEIEQALASNSATTGPAAELGGVLGAAAGPLGLSFTAESERSGPEELIEVIDAKGMSYWTAEPLTDLEQYMAFDDMDRQREKLDAQVERDLSLVIDQHRRELADAIDTATAEGQTEQSIDQLIQLVRFEFVQRYRSTITEYTLAVEQSAEQQATEELDRQVSDGSVEPSPAQEDAPPPTVLQRIVDSLGDMAMGQAEALQRGIARAAETLARRVEEDIVDGWGATALATLARDVRPIATYRQLVAPVRRLGNRAENTGRLIVATLGSQAAGLWVVETQRSSVRDKRRCGLCKSKHKKRWSLRSPEQVAAFMADPDAQLPDPECEGKGSCRCGLVPRYRRAPEGVLSAVPTRVTTSSGELSFAQGAAPALAARSWEGLLEGWRSIRRRHLPSIGQPRNQPQD